MLMAFALLTGFVNTLIIGAIARFASKLFASDEAGRLGAFWLAAGAAAGRYSYTGPWDAEAARALSSFVGGAAALVILWAWLLRRPVDEPTGDRD